MVFRIAKTAYFLYIRVDHNLEIDTLHMENTDKDWKLKLRYGKLLTPFNHVTILAKGISGELREGFICPPGEAFMGMKAWTLSDAEAVDMIKAIGNHIGFEVTGDIQIYYTEPSEPPREKPYGYDINFTPFNE